MLFRCFGNGPDIVAAASVMYGSLILQCEFVSSVLKERSATSNYLASKMEIKILGAISFKFPQRCIALLRIAPSFEVFHLCAAVEVVTFSLTFYFAATKF